jgi:hypothetical protein
MNARPNPPDSFARTVLDVAAQVEAAETLIKQAILDAAQAGDCGRIIDIVTRWQRLPAAEVLCHKGLASCGGLEVTQGTPPGPSTDGPGRE